MPPAHHTSRNSLATIRAIDTEPVVIEYFKTLPNRTRLKNMAPRMGAPGIAIPRQNWTPFATLGLNDPALSDNALADAIRQSPILFCRRGERTPARDKA